MHPHTDLTNQARSRFDRTAARAPRVRGTVTFLTPLDSDPHPSDGGAQMTVRRRAGARGRHGTETT